MKTPDEVLNQLHKWFQENENIRAAILTSSRVAPGATTDILSDYDIELYTTSLEPFRKNDTWLEKFGSIMVRWPYQPRSTFDKNWLTRLVLFKDGVRIDFQLTDHKQLEMERYDNGYQVLIDKDNLTINIPTPSYSAHIIRKPSKKEYLTLVNEFWWDAIYVPKYLWRNELPFAKYMLDYILHYKFLQKIVEWYIGLDTEWSVNTGNCGKHFKNYLDAETWEEFEDTFAGSDIEENWEAFYNTILLFRKLAQIVGEALTYEYPIRIDTEVTGYCRNIQKMKRNGE